MFLRVYVCIMYVYISACLKKEKKEKELRRVGKSEFGVRTREKFGFGVRERIQGTSPGSTSCLFLLDCTIVVMVLGKK